MKKITIIVKSDDRETITQAVKDVSYMIGEKRYHNMKYIDEEYWPIEMYKSSFGWKIEDYEPHNPYVDVPDEEWKKVK